MEIHFPALKGHWYTRGLQVPWVEILRDRITENKASEYFKNLN
jgi:hypothetical protein